jgi:hypothetical protein
LSSSEKEFKFTWKYKNGLTENFDRVFDEFKVYRQIKTFKLIVCGMPMLGKTHFAQL